MFTMSDKDVRLIQVFLAANSSDPVISYVSVNKKSKDISCTCAGFRGRQECKHVKFVQARVDRSSGTYPLELDPNAPDDAELLPDDDADTFREFVLKYGKIELI